MTAAAVVATESLRGPGAPPAPAATELAAGAWSARLEGDRLAHLRHGTADVARLVYVGVRDPGWGTVAPVLDGVRVQQEDDGFAVTLDAHHRAGELDLRGSVRMAATADGPLTFAYTGVAERGFPYARIGLCLLHAPAAYAGQPYRARRGGVTSTGAFPATIGIQAFRDGLYRPVVEPFDALEVELADGSTVAFAFTGDEFEVEDQRNWTDATFKTYSTPLERGDPADARPGERFEQRVTITVTPPAAPAAPVARRRASATVAITVGAPTGRRVPAIGTVLGPDRPPPGQAPPTGLAHVRVDVAAGGVAAPADPEVAAIELVLWAGAGDAEAACTTLAAHAHLPLARVLVFDPDAEVSDPGVVADVRDAARSLGLDAPVGGGTDYWFAELHRGGADLRGLDVLAFSITPQLHTFDDASILETLPVQATVAAAAAARAPRAALAVSPVTFVPRDSGALRAGLAPADDPRHASLLCAVWTAGSVGALAAAGVASATYFELAGPRGLMSTVPGRVHPVLPVLADACAASGAPVLEVRSDDPRRVCAWAVAQPAGHRVVLANLTPVPCSAAVSVPDDARLRLRTLDAGTVAAVGGFAEERIRPGAVRGRAALPLSPYAVCTLDVTRKGAP